MAVVLTHHHRDHTAGAWRTAAELGVPVRAHPETFARLDAGPAGAEAPERVDLHEGETIDLSGVTLRPLLTPGHAPGHLALHVPEREALLSGDLVSGLSTILIDPSTGDMDAYLASLRRATELPLRYVLPSHGPPLPAKALARAAVHREEREAKIRDALSDAQRRLSDIAREAYRDTPDAPAILAEMQTLAHLVRLERAGRARRCGDREDRWVAVEGE